MTITSEKAKFKESVVLSVKQGRRFFQRTLSVREKSETRRFADMTVLYSEKAKFKESAALSVKQGRRFFQRTLGVREKSATRRFADMTVLYLDLRGLS